MMKTKKIIQNILVLAIAMVCTDLDILHSQGRLSIAHIQSGTNNTTDLICGSSYTTILPYVDINNGIFIKEDTWQLTNNGDQALTINTPISFDANSPNFLAIISQPKATLAPGESTTFITTYEYKFGSNGSGYIDLSNNSGINPNCGFMLSGMAEIVSLCNCYCGPTNVIEEICPFGLTGYFGGIRLEESVCESGNDGTPCTSITLLGDCSCEDYLTIDSMDLFLDTLAVYGLPGTEIVLTENIDNDDYSFQNINGSPIRLGTHLGKISSTGELIYNVYRRPNTAINIRLNGVKYVSPSLCPTLLSCAEEEEIVGPGPDPDPIPTLSEWSLILLTICLLIVGLLAAKTNIKESRISQNKFV